MNRTFLEFEYIIRMDFLPLTSPYSLAAKFMLRRLTWMERVYGTSVNKRRPKKKTEKKTEKGTA
jgi:hypothetical protein